MSVFRNVIGVATALMLTAMSTAAVSAEPTKITFWHAMGGGLGETIDRITNDYNNSQSEYFVDTVYKGSYNDTYNAAIAAFRSKKAPHIVQALSWATGQFMSAKGAYVPV